MIMKMLGIKSKISQLLRRETKPEISYVSLRSKPCKVQDFGEVIRVYAQSDQCLVAPEGCFPVDVGQERKRYFVGISYLTHPLIRALLQRSSEEFGLDQIGVLTIPCDVESFQHVLWLVHSYPNPCYETVEEFVKYYVLISMSCLEQ